MVRCVPPNAVIRRKCRLQRRSLTVDPPSRTRICGNAERRSISPRSGPRHPRGDYQRQYSAHPSLARAVGAGIDGRVSVAMTGLLEKENQIHQAIYTEVHLFASCDSRVSGQKIVGFADVRPHS